MHPDPSKKRDAKKNANKRKKTQLAFSGILLAVTRSPPSWLACRGPAMSAAISPYFSSISFSKAPPMGPVAEVAPAAPAPVPDSSGWAGLDTNPQYSPPPLFGLAPKNKAKGSLYLGIDARNSLSSPSRHLLTNPGGLYTNTSGS